MTRTSITADSRKRILRGNVRAAHPAPISHPIQGRAPAAAVHGCAGDRRRRRRASRGDRGGRRRGGCAAAHQGHDRSIQHLVRPGRHRRGASAAGFSYESHVDDTENGGAGLCDDEAVESSSKKARSACWNCSSGARTSTRRPATPHDLAFGLEGGHSFARILHAYGDATGKELAQTLIRTVRSREIDPHLREQRSSIDLITDEGRLPRRARADRRRQFNIIWAKRTILASGGAGQLYRESTNPKIATADGHAMAYRAGATLQDMEMVQFHPTTLYVAGSSRALITEAVRGEGAYLVDRNGYRFMKDYHEMAGAGAARCRQPGDRRADPQDAFHARLPRRAPPADRSNSASASRSWRSLCDRVRHRRRKDLIPIHPAAHYMIGGVDADLIGPHEPARACTRSARRAARACTAPIGWRAIRCWKGWPSAPRRARCRDRQRSEDTIKFPQTLEHQASRRRAKRSWTSPTSRAACAA